ncbi:transforming growth factor beta receptor type 3-like [Gigantopelta aegis]|uniref:transforming growth factor beta receptor type 3-like n=1 Tax=Gigantopelta aegis TaxID=1735272 RepID=UPI001B88CB2C|nr:transforming growth factor beta receptor type 3-like [Gigantopelta aegis]
MLSSACFCFLLFLCCHEAGTGKVPRSKAQCLIASPFDSTFVSAYLTHYTSGQGCTSNDTTLTSQEVHVINVKTAATSQDRRIQVSLRIEPQLIADKEPVYPDHWKPLIFVLNSEVPVRWKVEVLGLPITRTRHLFVIPKQSTIRFKKSRIRKQFKGRTVSMPSSQNVEFLAKWVRKKFKALTSYSEVTGTSIVFQVGSDPYASRECNVTDLMESPFAMTSHMQAQPISGCVTTGRKNFFAKPVYIIEMLREPSDSVHDKPVTVELEVTSATNEPIDKDFYLIIKSPSDLKWDLRSRKVQGWIDIVTDAEVDLKGIRMHTVALRREVMESTGVDLINWAEYYIAPVESYARVPTANRIKLLLSTNDKRIGLPSPFNSVSSRGSNSGIGDKPKEMKDHIKEIIHTRCFNGRMEISIPKYLLQQLGLIKEQITLLDPVCGPTANSSHVILRTALTECHTKFLQVDDDHVYSNAIVIRAPEVADALMEELGSAFVDNSEMSGSGSHDLSDGTYVDDEDFDNGVEIDVQCKVSIEDLPGFDIENSTDNTKDGTGQYILEMFRDASMKQSIQFPVMLTENIRMYVQATTVTDTNIAVQIRNCWVSQEQRADKLARSVVLIRDSCVIEDSLSWETPVVTTATKHSTFSFNVYDFFTDGRFTYLHCELSPCRRITATGHLPQCNHRETRICEQPSGAGPRLPVSIQALRSGRLNNIVTIGPWEITDKEINIAVPGRDSEPVVDTSDKSSSLDAHVSTPPQHSVIIEGLDSATVVGIAFAAFTIGIILTAALWFIHTHTGMRKRGVNSQGSADTSGDLTPNSLSPISA